MVYRDGFAQSAEFVQYGRLLVPPEVPVSVVGQLTHACPHVDAREVFVSDRETAGISLISVFWRVEKVGGSGTCQGVRDGFGEDV